MIHGGDEVVFYGVDGNTLRVPLALFLLDVAEARTFAELRVRFVMLAESGERVPGASTFQLGRDDTVRNAYVEARGNVSRAARMISMSRTAFYYHVKRLGLRNAAEPDAVSTRP